MSNFFVDLPVSMPLYTGTVTSVALTAPSIFNVTGSPITTSGTFDVTLNTEPQNSVFAGPASGGAGIPTFRMLVASDIPALLYVSSVTASSPIFSSGGLTPNITLGVVGISNLPVSSGQSFLTSSTTYTTPSTINTNTTFKFTLIGGGGGGSSGNVASQHSNCGGGGGGLILYATGLSPSTSYNISIGAGGLGAISGAVGGNGGNTTLTIGSTIYTAGGGQAAAAIAGAGGIGGISTNGTINIQGMQGGADMSVLSSAGLAGGNAALGFGQGGTGLPSGASGNGNPGTGYGGGGGGASSNGAPTGGAGTQGCILVEWRV